MEGLFDHPVLCNADVVTLMEKINKKMIAPCNKMVDGLNSGLIKYWIIRVIIEDAKSVCLKNSITRESNAIIVKSIFTGLYSSSPNVSSWRKNTIIADIHSVTYIMTEKMFMGAVTFCKKFFGKIWNILKNAFKIVIVDNPTKNAVVKINAKNVDHPA